MTFIGLGMGGSLLGGAWPSMYGAFGVDAGAVGTVSMVLSASTILGTYLSARALRRFGTSFVLTTSLFLVAAAVLGSSLANHFVVLCLFAMVLGFGMGNMDAAGNSFLAMHYSAKYLNWLHCLWAVGATIGPAVMAFSLIHLGGWRGGYRVTGFTQLAFVLILLATLPLWKKAFGNKGERIEAQPEEKVEVPSIAKLLRLPGAPLAILLFFFSGGLGAMMAFWSATYLVIARDVSHELATSWFALYFLGLTVARLFAGFLTMRLHSRQIIYLGLGIFAGGIVTIALPFAWSLRPGLILTGVGMAPLFPNFVHNTASVFGKRYTSAMIGLQMVASYMGVTLLPPVFGQIGTHFGYQLFPIFTGLILVGTAVPTIILYIRHPDKGASI